MNQLGKWNGTLLMGLLLWEAVRCIGRAAQDPSMVIVGVGGAVGLSLIAGALFCRIWLPILCDNFTDFLYGASRRRAKAAPLFSAVAGDMLAGKTEEAMAELDWIAERYPGAPEGALLRFSLLEGPLNDPEAALTAAETFCDRRDRLPGEENLKLVLRHADCCQRFGIPERAAALLEREARKKRLYRPNERRQLLSRLAYLNGGEA